MEFKDKSVDEMGEWLILEKFSENTVQIFKGERRLPIHNK
jgi:hypothetical protein